MTMPTHEQMEEAMQRACDEQVRALETARFIANKYGETLKKLGEE